MNMLALLTIAVSILHCQGSPGAARHGAHGGEWSSWSSWTRDRECHDDHCDGASTETVDTPCTESDGTCDPWSPWGKCPTSSCDQTRSKECTETCTNDIWSEWGSWSTPCTHSCGGYKSRSRYCIKGDCPVNNPGCPGESSQTVDCDHANQGILITAYNQAEIFIPSTKETFQLPAIPGSPRVWHTLSGRVLCGGAYDNTSQSCLKLKSNGAGWQPYSALVESRMAHSAWDSPAGVLLMGGYYSADSTELLNNTGSTSQFTMNDNISYACAINDGAEVVLTGGFGNRKDVVRYSTSGFEGSLPGLNVGRQYHACTRFTDQYGQNTFLVAGGFTGLENTKSTEIFTAGATAWTACGELPHPGCEFRATNLNNVVYLLGGNTEILKFNPHSNNTWTLYDQMTEKAGSKLEISTINCRTVHNYWPKSH